MTNDTRALAYSTLKTNISRKLWAEGVRVRWVPSVRPFAPGYHHMHLHVNAWEGSPYPVGSIRPADEVVDHMVPRLPFAEVIEASIRAGVLCYQ